MLTWGRTRAARSLCRSWTQREVWNWCLCSHQPGLHRRIYFEPCKKAIKSSLSSTKIALHCTHSEYFKCSRCLIIFLLTMLANGNQSEPTNEQNVPERSNAVTHRSRAVFDELCVEEQFLQRVKHILFLHVLWLESFENLEEVDQVGESVQH